MNYLNRLSFLFVLLLLVEYTNGQNTLMYMPVNSGNGTNGTISSSAVYNGELYVSGSFTNAGGLTVNKIAKWNGSTWSNVGTGLNGTGYSMIVYNSELYVSGSFTNAGGVTVNNIAKWNGTNWSNVGTGINSWASYMEIFNSELYLSGGFTTAGGINAPYIAKWNGTTYSAVNGITFSNTGPMTVFNNELYVGAPCTLLSGNSYWAKWNGNTWSAPPAFGNYQVTSLASYSGALYLGLFGHPNGIMRYNGSNIVALGTGLSNGANTTNVMKMTTFNGELFLSGQFISAGGITVNNVAKWNGTNWSSGGIGINYNTFAHSIFNGELIVGGNYTFGFTRIRILKDEPSIGSSNIQFSGITSSSLNVSWTNGNGLKHLLVVKANSAVNAIPIDTQTYNANSNFRSGTNLGNNCFVVYKGSGNSVTVNNLGSDTIYHFAVFELNDSSSNGCENYLTSNYAIANRNTIAIEPTINTSNIIFSERTTSSLKITLNQGNGTKRLIIAKMGSAVDKMPIDTNAYVASSVFGSGTNLGNGNFAVYNGTSTSFSLNGLTAGTKYYLTVFEYNGTILNSYNYLTVGALTGTCATLQPEPTIQGTPLTNSISNTSIGIKWNGGNGNKHLLIATIAGVSFNLPIDTQVYTANPVFGNGTKLGVGGYVVYSGNSNAVTVTGLTKETLYNFYLFEYNDSITSGYENYLTTGYKVLQRTTLDNEPTIASSNGFAWNKSETELTFAFTKGNGKSRLIVLKENAPVDFNPIDSAQYDGNFYFGSSNANLGNGNFAIASGAYDQNLGVSNLKAGNNYYFKVFEYNGIKSTGGNGDYTNNYLITPTLSGVLSMIRTQPTIQSSNMRFKCITKNSVKVTWTNGNGKKRLLIALPNGQSIQTPTDTISYSASSTYGYGSKMGQNAYVVFNGSDSFAIVSNIPVNSNFIYHLFEYNDSNLTGLENYMPVSTSASFIQIAKEPTINASNMTANNAGSNSVKLNWTKGNGEQTLILASRKSPIFIPLPPFYILPFNQPKDTITYTAGAFGSGLKYDSQTYVVYTGSDSTAIIQGIRAGIPFYYYFISYNDEGIPGIENYINFNGNVLIDTLIAKQPNVTSSNIQFTARGQNSLTLDWQNGNGSKRLVLVHALTPVSYIPIDTVSYSSNSNIKLGTDLGGKHYVVYNGSGNNVSVNGLSPDTIYHFAIYEYNDDNFSGLENYLSNPASASHNTIATEPLTKGSISFENIGFNSMNVKLSPGLGKSRLVVVRAGSAVNQLPQDTLDYTANSQFGLGTDLGNGNYIVDKGNNSSFQLTGLTTNTRYYFAVFEYNGTTPSANNYLETNPAIAFQSTLTTEPTSPASQLQFTNVKDSTMTLSWTVGNGQRRLVIAGTSAIVTAPTEGFDHLASDTFGKGENLGFSQYVVYSGTSNIFNLRGLTPNTTYHFAVYEFNGTQTSNNYLLFNPAIGNISTLIAEPTLSASNLTLSPITNGITTLNWTNGNGANRIAIAREGLPINILPEDGKSYTANNVFGSGQDLGQGNFVCYIGSNNTFNLQGLDPSKVYYVVVIEYSGSGGGSNYKLNTFPMADNLPASPTSASKNMVFSNKTNTSVTLSWTKGNGAYRMVIAKENNPITKSPVDGIFYTANNNFGSGSDLGLGCFVVYNGSGNTTTVTNLANDTRYYFAVYEFNRDISGPANYYDTPLRDSVDIGFVGLNNPVSLPSEFTIYPNPAQPEFYIDNAQLHDMKVQIININGSVMNIIQSKASRCQIKTDDLQAGVYFVNVISGDKSIYAKIIIQH